MSKYMTAERISVLLQIVQVILALLGLVLQTSLFLIAILMLCSSTIIYLIHKQMIINQYVQFIEFLMNNKQHNFVLLPKLRMYLRSEKICNKIKIKNMDVKYLITRSNDKNE